MIKSVYKKIHPATGIISILIDTVDRWVEYQVRCATGKAGFSFYTAPKNPFDDYTETAEWIELNPDFNPFDYLIYKHQEKDQITLILIPKALLLNREEWIDYDERTV